MGLVEAFVFKNGIKFDLFHDVCFLELGAELQKLGGGSHLTLEFTIVEKLPLHNCAPQN